MRKLIPILLLVLAVSPAARSQSSQEAMSIDHAIQDLSKLTNPANPSAYNKVPSFVTWHGDREPPKGSRLLFDSWPKGFVLGTYDTVLKDPNLFLNYDKITHVLYFTLDGKNFIKVETSQARELHFLTGDTQIVLTRVNGIDPQAFFQRLSDSVDTRHYILYRLLKTQYRRADYRTDGLVTTGNDYDEYVDSYEYYLVMPGGREYTPLKLSKRSVRETLGQKAKPWFEAHPKEKIAETGLTALINTLNK